MNPLITEECCHGDYDALIGLLAGQFVVTDARAADLLAGASPADEHELAFLARAHALTVAEFEDRKKQLEAMLKEVEADLAEAKAAAALAAKALADVTGGQFFSPFYGGLEHRESVTTTYPDKGQFEAYCRAKGWVTEKFPGIGDLQKRGYKWTKTGALLRRAEGGEPIMVIPGIHRETSPRVVFVPTAPDELAATLEQHAANMPDGVTTGQAG